MNPYAVKLAIRHLLSHPGQTALLMAGVALGVGVFIFMSALIGGLATLLTLRTVGSIPHVVLEMPDRDPTILVSQTGAQVVMQKDLSRREQIAIWQPAVPIIHNVDVARHDEPAEIVEALACQLWQPVRWTRTIEKLAADGVTRFAECGPGKVLSGLNRRIARGAAITALASRADIEQLMGETES